MKISLPILGGMMSQNVLNLVDAAFVGQLGSVALAAVGISSFINFMTAAFFIGLAAGVQAICARRMGEQRYSEVAYPLNGTLLFILVTAIPVSIILVVYAEQILDLFLDDQQVIDQGIPYLQARMAGIIFIGMNFSFRSFWSAINKTEFYLRTLLIMHVINIFLNYTLIFGHFGFPEMGVMGAGLGTTISLAGGTLIYAYLAFVHCKPYGFAQSLPQKDTLVNVLRVSIPAAIQQLFFAGGFTLLFWIVGQVGTQELAAAHVITTVTLVAILPCIAFGISTSTLVAQALGRGDAEDAYRWAWDVAQLTAGLIVLIGIPMVVMPDLILGMFIKEQGTIECARLSLQIVGIAIAFDAVGIIMLHALQGAGDTKRAMFISAGAQWAIFLPIAYFIGPVLGYGLTAIWICQMVYRLGQGFVFMMMWNKKKWQTIKV
jgi:multidrug resistance protein, MATE family